MKRIIGKKKCIERVRERRVERKRVQKRRLKMKKWTLVSR